MTDGLLSVGPCPRCERPVLRGRYCGLPVVVEPITIPWEHARVVLHYTGVSVFSIVCRSSRDNRRWVFTEPEEGYAQHVVAHLCNTQNAKGRKP